MTSSTALPVRCVRFGPGSKSRLLALGRQGGPVVLWELKSPNRIRALEESKTSLDLAFSSDGARLASPRAVWDVATGELRRILPNPDGAYGVSFRPHSRELATGGIDRTVRLWNADADARPREISSDHEEIHCICFSPDGSLLATGGMDCTLRLRRLLGGETVRTFRESGCVICVDFSPDGKLVATATTNGTEVRLWDCVNGRQVGSVQAAGVRDVAFSPDGTALATADATQTVGLWDGESGDPIRAAGTGSPDLRFLSLSFSTDGAVLAGGGNDGRVTLWDVSTGEELVSLFAFEDGDWAAVAPAGRYDGSPMGIKQLTWTENGKSAPLGSSPDARALGLVAEVLE